MYQYIGIILICFAVSGCASSSITAILWAKTGLDGFLMLKDEPTTTEYVLNKATGKDCRLLNIIKGKSICLDNEIEKMMEMDCNLYSWTNDEEVYCKYGF